MATTRLKAPVTAFIPTAPPVLPLRGLLVEDELLGVVELLEAVGLLAVVAEPPLDPVDVPVLPPLSCRWIVRPSSLANRQNTNSQKDCHCMLRSNCRGRTELPTEQMVQP